MRKLILAVASLAMLAISGAAAFAADMPLKAVPYGTSASPSGAVWSWTGVYVGGNVGYSWGNWRSSSVSAIFPGPSTTANPAVDGWVAGGQIGYNWQVSPQWLVGLEGDLDWSGERASDPTMGSTSAPAGIVTGICDAHPPCTATTTTAGINNWKLPWFATFRGRVGLIENQTWLFYGTGGLAVGATGFATGSTSTTTVTNAVGAVFPGFPTGTASYNSQTVDRVGFAVGGGVEKMLSPNWTVKAEYLFLDFGSYTFLSGTGVDTNVKLIDNVVRLGVNYKFGG